MYLKWQGQFWSAGCSGASSASHGAAERTLCCWLLAAGHGAVPLLSAHSEVREMPLQTMSAPWVSWWKWNEHAYSWKKTTRGLPQFLHPRQVPFWCPLSKELHHHFLSMLPSAVAAGPVIVPQLWLLLSFLQASLGCSSSLATHELLPSSLGPFLWSLAAQAWLCPAFFIPQQLLQAISFTFPRRI